jgi:hypothetical protein
MRLNDFRRIFVLDEIISVRRKRAFIKKIVYVVLLTKG